MTMFCVTESCEEEALLYFLPCCNNSICGVCLMPKKKGPRSKKPIERDCPRCYSSLPKDLPVHLFANNLRNLHRKVNKQLPINWEEMNEIEMQRRSDEAKEETARIEEK